MAECFEQSPVSSSLVGIGQSRERYSAADPEVVKLGTLRVETSHQVAQTFLTRELGIRDTEEVGPCREMSNALVRGKAINEVLEVIEGSKVQQLRINLPPTIHDTASFARKIGKVTATYRLAISNRRNLKSFRNPRQCCHSVS